RARDLERALRRRGIQLQPINPADADVGPSIVRFKFRLNGNESIKKVQAAAVDLARDLAVIRTPFIDNVLGSHFVGVDLPREHPETVELADLLPNLPQCSPGELPTIIGKTPDGRLHIEDLSEFPHLLVAGATGSGKSVFLRSVLLGLMTIYRPGGLELMIVDPKQTDFSFFDDVPYLRGGKVFTQAEEARDALLELVRSEMPRRQQLMRGRSLKIKEFNKRFPDEALPPIVALIDEYAQLLSIQTKKEAESFERDLMSLAAVARSTGIHLILATQRPSVNVVTGTLKANLPTRIAFQVPTNNDSRVVLDMPGAENLLGRGDMLFRRSSGELVRVQAPFMGEEEMQAYIAALSRQYSAR
ncbi:MAG TPA: DNA translocase FtsK, partial [Roseiflexaceae bacterium]|nr:DNA translocase FtsK [Roseiflexaceae bacterium]